jgi:hypothetical protein
MDGLQRLEAYRRAQKVPFQIWAGAHVNTTRMAFADFARLMRLIGPALFLATIVQELRKPREQRTWHGNVFGFIPYDYRPPTLTRIKESFWNPADHHLFTPRPMGIGWAVNVYELRRRLSGGPSRGGGPDAFTATAG